MQTSNCELDRHAQLCCVFVAFAKFWMLWQMFFELRVMETLCVGKRGNLFARPFYIKHPLPATELQMHKDCIRTFQKVGWRLVAHEWKAKTKDGRVGVGDLVFEKGNVYIVMECKRRNKQKVYDQSLYYARAWSEKHGSSRVLYGVWTCKSQELIGRWCLINFYLASIGSRKNAI